MTDQDRLSLIMSQANIAKAAVAAEVEQTHEQESKNLQQALLAIEAILILSDSKLQTSTPLRSTAA